MHQRQLCCITCVLLVAKCFGQVVSPQFNIPDDALCQDLQHAFTQCCVAVNTYFRAVLAEAVRRADFEPRRYAELANCQSTVTPACVREPNLITEQPTLESIPSSVLELVLQHTNLLTVCNAATVSTSLQKVNVIASS